MSTQRGGPDADFRKLMERLFFRPRHGLEPFLYVGELPPGWDMPLPDSTAVVGSLVTSEFLVQVILEVPGDSEQAVTAVAQGLWATGWRTSRGMPGLRPGGFVLTGMERSQIGIILCDDQRRRHVQISSDSGEAGLADVRLDLNSDPDGFVICEGIDRMFRDPTSIFPALGPPPGMSLGGGGSSGGIGSSYCHTTLRGTLPVEDIESHYREQLAAVGWSLSEHAATRRWAWSVWDFLDERGEPWTALLTVVVSQEQPNVRHASLAAIADRSGRNQSASVRLLGSF